MNDTMVKYTAIIERKRRVHCFMDGIDWQHHLGVDREGSKLFTSVNGLREGIGHDVSQCGIVEVEVRIIGWVEPQNLHQDNKDRPVERHAADKAGAGFRVRPAVTC